MRFLWLVLALAMAAPAAAMSLKERLALDLSDYRVTKPEAAFFDVATRRAYLDRTPSDMLRLQAADLKMGRACRNFLELPMIDHRAVMPPFYAEQARWRDHSRPYLALEEAVHELAAAQMVADDRYHGDCLLDVLVKWARAGNLLGFYYSKDHRQAWYQIESVIFASAMAFSTVLPVVKDRAEEVAEVKAWLLAAARRHSGISGVDGGTCCNNHFYRRALYAAMVGVVTGDDALFRFGVSAVYSAVDGALENGALPLEMQRGALAAHYQNYAVMYLVWIAEIARLQGYDLYAVEVEGRNLHRLVDFNMAVLEDLAVLDGLVSTPEQKLTYQQDDQYFAWFELYLARFPRRDMEEVIAVRRPLYNRSAGGYTTLIYYQP